MNRVIIEKHELAQNGKARFGGYKAEHIIKVLHAKVGDKIRIGRLNGPKGYGTLTKIDGETVSLK